jgi:hypothetical protein
MDFGNAKHPPKYVKLRDGDDVFWYGIVRARNEWARRIQSHLNLHLLGISRVGVG